MAARTGRLAATDTRSPKASLALTLICGCARGAGTTRRPASAPNTFRERVALGWAIGPMRIVHSGGQLYSVSIQGSFECESPCLRRDPFGAGGHESRLGAKRLCAIDEEVQQFVVGHLV